MRNTLWFVKLLIIEISEQQAWWSQPINNQCSGWIRPHGCYDCVTPIHDNYQKSFNKGLLLTRPGSYTPQLEPHSEVKGRESLRSWVWGSAFIWFEGTKQRILLTTQFCKVKVKSLSRVQLLATPWTAAYQAPLPMGFARQEYWSWVPSP